MSVFLLLFLRCMMQAWGFGSSCFLDDYANTHIYILMVVCLLPRTFYGYGNFGLFDLGELIG
jgi:hypothetical protein